MMYLSLCDASIEIIQTKKTLFGEKVIGTAFGLLPEGIVVKGSIVDVPALAKFIESLTQAAHPGPMTDTQLAIALPDDTVIFERFSLPREKNIEQEMQQVLSTATHKAAHQPQIFENYYKILAESKDSTLVFYTAIEKKTLSACVSLARELQLELVYTTSRIFSFYELLRDLITEGQIVIAVVMHTQSVEYLMVDMYGPVAYAHQYQGKHHTGTQAISSVITTLKGNQALGLSGVIVTGEGVQPETIKELSSQLQTSVQPLQDGITSITKSLHINDVFGGVPESYFTFSLGVYAGRKRGDAPNLVLDQMPEPISQDMFSVVEKKSSHAPFVLFVIFLLICLAFGAYFIIGKSKMMNSASTIPLLGRYVMSPTPTLTLTPTLTPTPTKNPNVKRSDLHILVQNGTSISGYAKQIADILEKKGYKTIDKSNADNTDYTKPVIKIKDRLSVYKDVIVEDVTSILETPEVSTLNESDPHDVVLILGKK